jgi:hypothetical protein
MPRKKNSDLNTKYAVIAKAVVANRYNGYAATFTRRRLRKALGWQVYR